MQSLDLTKTLISACNRGPGKQTATLGATEAASGAKGPRDYSESVGQRGSGRRAQSRGGGCDLKVLEELFPSPSPGGRGERGQWGGRGARTDAWAWSLMQTTTRRGYLTATGACGRMVVGRGQEESARTSQQSTEKWLLSHKCHGGYQIRHRLSRCH